jgi:iron donor protein CyaY
MASESEFPTDSAYRQSVGALLEGLMLQADEIDADDLDVRLTPGNLQIVFEDVGATFVLSQQTPTHELWLSANLTAWHFRCVDGTWVERDSGEDLLALLGRLVSEKVGGAVVFRV